MSACYLVAGLGKTGQSVARYLYRRQKPFVVFDTRHEVEALAEFNKAFPGVEVFLGDFPDALFEKISTVITSPGISLEEPFIKKSKALGIPIWGDIECLAREVSAPVIAITGTNGKSTVTALVGEMAKTAGISVAVGGNIGTPVLDLLDDENHYDLWVLELSSFQLEETFSLKPLAATVLNITPDHLDRHFTIEAYIKTKQQIYHCADNLVYNREDSKTIPVNDIISGNSTLVSFGLDEPAAGQWGLLSRHNTRYLAKGEVPFMPVEALRIKGQHNWQNALAACALAESAGIAVPAMVTVLQRFSGLPHRSQWVRTIEGVDWINDSKGTNIGATISAISGIGGSMQGKIVLIAGGLGKGADFSELREPMADYVRSVVLIGKDADQIEKAIAGSVNVIRAPSLDEAVILAKSQAQAGDVVLLSPACASQDMFRDFNHRGDLFTAAVNAL